MAIFTVRFRQASTAIGELNDRKTGGKKIPRKMIESKVIQCRANSIVEAAGQFRGYKIESISRVTK